MEAFYDHKAMANAPRAASPLLALFNLNNRVKARLIQKYTPAGGVALDLCGGRGGDLRKWEKARIRKLVLVDLSAGSVLEARSRYRKGNFSYEARFLAADCTEPLDEVPVGAPFFDVVSCQFALHYSFDTFDRATRTLQNVGQRLKKGGHFIGTIPSAERILARFRKLPSHATERRFGNVFYSVHMKDELTAPDMYTFSLTDAIDEVPEALVRLQALLVAASLAGLTPVHVGMSFEEFLTEQGEPDAAHALSVEQREIFALYDVFVFQKKFY